MVLDENTTNESEENGVPGSAGVQNRSSFEPVGHFLWDLSKVIVLALVLVVVIRLFVFQPFVVSGNSMEPNFNNGDYLIIDELSYLFSEPERGDVVVLRFPKDETQFFIKRVIGLPGERVEISQNKVKIYSDSDPAGKVLREDYLASGTVTAGNETIVLKSDEYFVLGDNRASSSDSRIWGVLPRRDIIGKVFVRVLPFDDYKVFHKPSYSTN